MSVALIDATPGSQPLETGELHLHDTLVNHSISLVKSTDGTIVEKSHPERGKSSDAGASDTLTELPTGVGHKEEQSLSNSPVLRVDTQASPPELLTSLPPRFARKPKAPDLPPSKSPTPAQPSPMASGSRLPDHISLPITVPIPPREPGTAVLISSTSMLIALAEAKRNSRVASSNPGARGEAASLPFLRRQRKDTPEATSRVAAGSDTTAMGIGVDVEEVERTARQKGKRKGRPPKKKVAKGKTVDKTTSNQSSAGTQKTAPNVIQASMHASRSDTKNGGVIVPLVSSASRAGTRKRRRETMDEGGGKQDEDESSARRLRSSARNKTSAI